MNKRNPADEILPTNTLMAETLRATAVPPVAPPPARNEDEKVSLFWRVFGGTILSVAALAGLTLYNTLTSGITELRAEVARLNEAKVDAAKKEEVTTLRTLAGENRREIDGLRDQLGKAGVELEGARKEQSAATECVRKDLSALEKDLQKALTEVREKIARLEGQQAPAKPPAASPPAASPGGD